MTIADQAATLTALASFDGADGSFPNGSLIADASGDLLGTATLGGVDGVGNVFELAKTPTGYASTPTTLASFDEANGAVPVGGLIIDGYGDLLGTTNRGGKGFGTAFELPRTATGYASAPITLASFDGANGAGPNSLITDSQGDLSGQL